MAFKKSLSKKTKRLTSVEPGARDPDGDTDDLLLRGQKITSKGGSLRMRVMSAIVGNTQPTRIKLFSTVQADNDCKLFSTTVDNELKLCAKVYNPLLLEKNPNIWNSLASVQRFELEDPEGTLTSIPKHYATNMQHLESFSITWTKVKSVPVELFRQGLKTLSLARNQIKTLTGIEKAVDLSNLDVSSNLLRELPKTLGQLQNLTTLKISGNAVAELPANFGSLNRLSTLDCSCNRLSVLPNCICNLTELKSLDVGNNSLSELPDGLVNLSNLEDLQAQVNQLEKLPNGFDQLTKLSSLNLRKNRFTEVPPQLSGMTSLHTLNMKDNNIRTFPSAIRTLKTLILDSNDLEEMPAELVKCSNLQMASLQDNRILTIPAEIRNLSSLRVLHLSRNQIDEVPEDIGALGQLRHLSLRATQIKTLPNAILAMSELVKLDITECPQFDQDLALAFEIGSLAQLKEELRRQNDKAAAAATTRTTTETVPSNSETTTDRQRRSPNTVDSSSTEAPDSGVALFTKSKHRTMLWTEKDCDFIRPTEAEADEPPQSHQTPEIAEINCGNEGDNEGRNEDAAIDDCNRPTQAKIGRERPPIQPKPKPRKVPDN